MNRKIAAHYVFPLSSPPIKNGLIEIDNKGTIISLSKFDGTESYGVEHYNGIICPGFVNSHCHIELSHLKDEISQGCGMTNFIKSVQKIRNEKPERIAECIERADKTMFKQGVSAIADICNNDISLELKKNSEIHYYNFIELFGLIEEKAETVFLKSQELINKYKTNSKIEIAPHSFYSLSEKLFNLLSDYFKTKNTITSIHFQESEDEIEWLENSTGKFSEIFSKAEFDLSIAKKFKLELLLKLFSKNNRILFIHNTFTNRKSYEFIKENFADYYFVFCPNSNLYINNKAPHIAMFLDSSDRICIGTDSYASNKTLNMLEEIKTIQNIAENVSFNEMLKWSCINGAKALGIENKYGSIEPGKTPGLVLIENFDYSNLKLKNNSFSVRLA